MSLAITHSRAYACMHVNGVVISSGNQFCAFCFVQSDIKCLLIFKCDVIRVISVGNDIIHCEYLINEKDC